MIGQPIALKAENLSNVQAVLTRIWQEVFEMDDIKIQDEFYDLGGNSLFSISIISKINKELGLNISLAEFLRMPELTIENTSSYILSVACNNNLVSHASTSEAINDYKIAEERILEKFNYKNRIIEYAETGKKYIVLYLENSGDGNHGEIMTFINNNFDKGIMPHYIRSLSELPDDSKLTSDLLQLKKENIDDLSSIIKEIKNSEKKFFEDILSGNAIKKYQSSPVQTGQVEQPFSVVGTIMHFDEYIDRHMVEKSISKVLSKHALLRSVLCKEDGKMFWNEFKTPVNIRLPFIDLSEWDFLFQKKGIIELIKEWYLENFKKFDSPLYRVLLVKLNLREYILFFPIHFTIFDGTSSGILQRGIRNYYSAYKRGIEIKDMNSASYADYIKQISKGPQNISADEIIQRFNLKEYNETLNNFNLSLKSKTASNTFIPYLCDVVFKQQEEDAKNEWELTYGLFYLISRKYFNVRSIPTGIVGFGRRYQENRYFDTMGELVDTVPYVVGFDGVDFSNSSNNVQEIFAVAQNHNINFMSFLHNEKIRKDWQKVIGLVYPSKNEIEYPFIFNFQGRLESDIMAMRDIFEPLRYKSYMDQYKKKEKNDNPISLFFNAFFIKNVLKINITTHYIKEKETLKNLFEEGCEIINSNFNTKLELKKIESYGLSSH